VVLQPERQKLPLRLVAAREVRVLVSVRVVNARVLDVVAKMWMSVLKLKEAVYCGMGKVGVILFYSLASRVIIG